MAESHACDIGATVRIVRSAKGLRLSDVAKLSRISVPYLSLLERGERQPSLAVLYRIADALRIPPELLVLMAMPRSGRLRPRKPATKKLMAAIDKLERTEQALRRALEPIG